MRAVGRAGGRSICEYEVVAQIEGEPCGFFGPEPFGGYAINDHGHVAGAVLTCDIGPARAAWWNGEQIIELPLPPGMQHPSVVLDINNDGVMVGECSTASPETGARGFTYDHGKFTILAPLPDGSGVFAHPRAINKQGLVVGTARIERPDLDEAYIWVNGEPVNLDPTSDQPSRGVDVNDHAMIVGYVGSQSLFGGMDALVFTMMEEDVTFLPVTPNSLNTRAEAVNNLGQVLTRGQISADPRYPQTKLFIWNESVYIVIDEFAQFNIQGGTDINDAGQVIGLLRQVPDVDEPEDVGFLWQNGQMIRVVDLVPKELGAVFAWVDAMNNHGEMVVSISGFGPFSGTIILRPIKSNSADITNDCEVDIHDLRLVLKLWDADNSIGDITGDGAVDVFDLLAVLNDWD